MQTCSEKSAMSFPKSPVLSPNAIARIAERTGLSLQKLTAQSAGVQRIPVEIQNAKSKEYNRRIRRERLANGLTTSGTVRKRSYQALTGMSAEDKLLRQRLQNALYRSRNWGQFVEGAGI